MVAVPAVGMPPFTASVEHVTRADVRFSWRPGCPVALSALRRIRLEYVGFDGEPHAGQVVVNVAVVPEATAVFRKLYGERFPIRRMQPVDAYRGSDERSMAADNTSAFNCRYAVAPGPKSWSVHAYGEAIDVNPVENPYIEGGAIRPAAGAAYADRGKVRRGMAVAGGVLVRAFALAGWPWGGRWSSTPDYQHFSANGR
jgi:hypothetical protein